ncbi:MAG TPA: ribbon-helix-helix protein, CopG family [Gammaproteobacteria bacterium]
MKVAISIPDTIFEAAERLARRLGKSRSELYAEAVSEYLAEHRTDEVTEKLNAVYAGQSSSLEPGLQKTQVDRLSEEDW